MYRPLWYDELISWHISRLPDIGAIWNAILAGFDFELPLMHLSMRWSHVLFGDGNLASRLPMLLGFWIMMLGVYCFLSRRLPWRYALIGMVFPMLTFAWTYAFEARAYGIALGGTGIALVCWQNAAEGRNRRLSLVGITVGLAIVLAVQATLAVAAIPFVLAEAVRTLDKRRIDWPVWLSFLAATPVMILYPPVRNSIRQFHFHGMQLSAFGIARFFEDALKPAMFPLLIAGLVAWYAGRNASDKRTGRLLPRHETVALVGFLLTPLPFFFGGLVSDQMIFFPRYGLLAMIGVAGGFAVLLCGMAGGNQRTATAVLAALVIWVAVAHGKEALAQAHDPVRTWREDSDILVKALAKNAPVVVTSPLTFVEADYYLDADLASHLYWVASEPDVAEHYAWQQFWNHSSLQAAKKLPLHVQAAEWKEFAARNPAFYLYTDPETKWWFEVLPREGWRLTMDTARGGQILYYVDRMPQR
jgi:hypothetical protein